MFFFLKSGLRSSRFFSVHSSRSINPIRTLWSRTTAATRILPLEMAPKRKRSSIAAEPIIANGFMNDTTILPPAAPLQPPSPKSQASRRNKVDTNPDRNADIVDGKTALRASPDADEKGEALDIKKIEPSTLATTNGVKRVAQEEDSDSPLSEIEALAPSPIPTKKPRKTPTKSSIAAKKGSDEIKAFKAEQVAKKAAEVKVKKEKDGDEWDNRVDPDGDDEAPVEDVDTLKKEAARPPPVNSDYLPLPWKGRLGYVGGLRDNSTNLLNCIGMPKHLPTIFQSTSLYLADLQNSLHHRTSTSSERSITTRTCNQEST
jgi:hypothetical protein